MTARRPLGVRTHLVVAMVFVAIASVAVSAAVINDAVDTELADFSQRDLRVAAANASEMAASVYLEAGGWTERSVMAVRAIAEARGDEVVVLGADGRPVVGSPASATQWTAGERTPIIVEGSQVGTILANHAHTGGVDNAAERLDHRLRSRMSGLLMEAGAVAGALAVLLRVAHRAAPRPAVATSHRGRRPDGVGRARHAHARGGLRRRARDHAAGADDGSPRSGSAPAGRAPPGNGSRRQA